MVILGVITAKQQFLFRDPSKANVSDTQECHVCISISYTS